MEQTLATVITINQKQQETIKMVKRNLNDKLQVSNGELHFSSPAISAIACI